MLSLYVTEGSKAPDRPKWAEFFTEAAEKANERECLRNCIAIDCTNNQLQKSNIGADNLKTHDETEVAETAAE